MDEYKEVIENQDECTAQLSTKVTPDTQAHMDRICKKFGYNIYVCLRFLAEVFVRFGDDRHNLNENIIRAVLFFEDLPGWNKSICLIDPSMKFGVVEAFYVLRAKGKDGNRIVHVKRPFLEGDPTTWESTYNMQYIFERFIELSFPSLYRHLRLLNTELGTSSMIDTINRMAESYMDNPDVVELRAQFERCMYHNGKDMADNTRYKRPYSHSMDYVDTQTSLFEDKNNE